MTATQIDPRPHFTAIQTLLNAELTPNAAYAPDKVPGAEQNADDDLRAQDLPDIYAELDVQPRYVPPRGMVPRSSRGGWRISTLCVGSTYNECLWVIAHVAEALRNVTWAVQSDVVGPAIAEPGQKPVWNENAKRWSARTSFTYSH